MPNHQETQQNQPKVVVDLKGGSLGFSFDDADLMTIENIDGSQQSFLMSGDVTSKIDPVNPGSGQTGWVKYNPTNQLTDEYQYALLRSEQKFT